MSALTLFCVITFVQIMPAVSFVLGFYLLARSIGAVGSCRGSQLLNRTMRGHKSDGLAGGRDGDAAAGPGALHQTAWLVNGPEALSALGFVALQTSCLRRVLLVLAGLFDLYRKNL